MSKTGVINNNKNLKQGSTLNRKAIKHYREHSFNIKKYK